ncbi:DUF2235 domain-containing protein [Ancylobacter sp.]|uniref:DUF2235 domain-containing protein n=1 Tax=Ancylobacter sp. TaxID=1872567 RepID=UPI003D12904E
MVDTVPAKDTADEKGTAPRNIVVFSDGTGQAGGILVDEARSNVYKLFRATRCGPDTAIDPDKQIAFYDPGLGSALAGEGIRIGVARKVYNALSSATGLGISRNIIDCYAALIQLWRPGDRIFLFGFSRGAYTVRCLGGVLGLCGIPTKMPDGSALLRDPVTCRGIAKEAIGRVYSRGSGIDDHGQEKDKARKARLGEQRQALGAQFREQYGSQAPEGSNAVPYFIGVWDTVAAVGLSAPAMAVVKWATPGLAIVASFIMGWIAAPVGNVAFWVWFAGTLATLGIVGLATYVALRIKFVTDLPGVRTWDTMHLMSLRMSFFDRSLNKRVRYARHALAIDEARADFDRVPWVTDVGASQHDLDDTSWFQQVWFAGNHSDIGGSYPENESRLSDIALEWMAKEARTAGLLVDEHYLRPAGRALGPQHDECRMGVPILWWRYIWRKQTREIKDNAVLHETVLERFQATHIVGVDQDCAYRPDNLRTHAQCRTFYATSDCA